MDVVGCLVVGSTGHVERISLSRMTSLALFPYLGQDGLDNFKVSGGKQVGVNHLTLLIGSDQPGGSISVYS